MDRTILRKWLKSGYMEKYVFHETVDGTPQGGIISPALANLALDGLEQLLREKFPKVTVKSAGGQPCVNFIRHADDFIITGRTKELLEREIKPLIEQFLRERGLELIGTWRAVVRSNMWIIMSSSMHSCDGFGGGIRKNLQAGSNRNTLSGIEVSTGVSSEKYMTAMGSLLRYGCSAPAAHPSNGILRLKVKQTRTI